MFTEFFTAVAFTDLTGILHSYRNTIQPVVSCNMLFASIDVTTILAFDSDCGYA
jgi:hypothetical protein